MYSNSGAPLPRQKTLYVAITLIRHWMPDDRTDAHLEMPWRSFFRLRNSCPMPPDQDIALSYSNHKEICWCSTAWGLVAKKRASWAGLLDPCHWCPLSSNDAFVTVATMQLSAYVPEVRTCWSLPLLILSRFGGLDG